MDLIPSEIGQLVAADGELPVSDDRQTLLKTYLKAALLTALQDSDFSLNRLSTATNNKNALELQARKVIIEYLNASAFGSDFDTSKLSVTLTGPDGNGDVSFAIEYAPGENSIIPPVTEQFSITGGALLLSEPDFTYPIVLQDETEFITEEFLLETITDKLLLAAPAHHPVFVLKPGERIQTVTLRGNVKDIDPGQRRTVTITDPTTGEPRITIGAQDPFGTPNSNIDSIFLSDIDSDNVFGGKQILYVNDLKGNIRSIQFIDGAEDYALIIDDADPTYEIEVGYGNALAVGQDTISIETRSLDDIMDPYPAAGKHGPHICYLDKPIDEGLYTLVYRALGRSDYNGSMWRQ